MSEQRRKCSKWNGCQPRVTPDEAKYLARFPEQPGWHRGARVYKR